MVTHTVTTETGKYCFPGVFSYTKFFTVYRHNYEGGHLFYPTSNLWRGEKGRGGGGGGGDTHLKKIKRQALCKYHFLSYSLIGGASARLLRLCKFHVTCTCVCRIVWTLIQVVVMDCAAMRTPVRGKVRLQVPEVKQTRAQMNTTKMKQVSHMQVSQ